MFDRTRHAAWRSARVWAVFAVIGALVASGVVYRVYKERIKSPAPAQGTESNASDTRSIRDTFTAREVQDSFVRPLGLTGIDSSWHVKIGGRVIDDQVYFMAWRGERDSGAIQCQIGRYNLASGASETIALHNPIDSRISPPALRGDGLIWAQLEGASETGGLLAIRDRSKNILIAVPVPGVMQIIGWAGPNAILLSMSDWKRDTFAYRGRDGSMRNTRGEPKPTAYRMIRFREVSETHWTVERIDEIPLFPNEEAATYSGPYVPSRQVMILRGDSSAVVLRNTFRSTSEPSEEWIYHIDQRTTEPRGIFIDGREEPGYAAPCAAFYGRCRLYNDNPHHGQSLHFDPASIPFVPGSNRQIVDTQALATMLKQQYGTVDGTPPRERLEWVSGGKTYLIEQYSDSWTVDHVLRLVGREFWFFTEKVNRRSGDRRSPPRHRLSLLDDATKTSFNFTAESSRQFPSSFAYNETTGVIYFAVCESTGWTLRCISFAYAGCSVGPVAIPATQAVVTSARSTPPADTRSIPAAARPFLGRHFFMREGTDNIEYVIYRIEPYRNDAVTEFPELPLRDSALINNRVMMYYRPIVPGRNGYHSGGHTISLAELKPNMDTAAVSGLFASVVNYSLAEITAMATRERCAPSKSIADARNRGVLVLVLSADTTDIAYAGDQARLTEIWLESCSNRTPQWSDAGNLVPHYHLCFATNKAASHYSSLFPCFTLRGSRKCFDVTHSGDTAVFISPAISSPPSLPVSVISSDFQRNVVFTVSASRQVR